MKAIITECRRDKHSRSYVFARSCIKTHNRRELTGYASDLSEHCKAARELACKMDLGGVTIVTGIVCYDENSMPIYAHVITESGLTQNIDWEGLTL